jgi:hypothetical protein
MKKKFLDTLVGRVFVGALGAVPYVGKDIQNELKQNVASPIAGEGSVDYARLFGYLMVGALFVLKILDIITWEDLEAFIKIIFKLD